MGNPHLVFEVANSVPNNFTFYPVSMRNAANHICIFRSDYDAKADSHVVREEHFFIGNPAIVLDKTENGMGLGQAVDNVGDLSSGSSEIQETCARDVRQRFYIEVPLKHLQDFLDINPS